MKIETHAVKQDGCNSKMPPSKTPSFFSSVPVILLATHASWLQHTGNGRSKWQISCFPEMSDKVLWRLQRSWWVPVAPEATSMTSSVGRSTSALFWDNHSLTWPPQEFKPLGYMTSFVMIWRGQRLWRCIHDSLQLLHKICAFESYLGSGTQCLYWGTWDECREGAHCILEVTVKQVHPSLK